MIFSFCLSRTYALSLFRFFSVFALVVAAGGSHAFDFSGEGDGDATSPYEIATAEQLDEVRNHLGKHFSLTEDIDLGGNPWNPIGSSAEPFTGELVGNGHTISGLYVNIADYDAGLFAEISGGAVRNLFLTDVDVTGSGRVGAFAGRLRNSDAEDLWASGSVSSDAFHAGGLFGISNDGSTIRRSGANVQVSSAGDRIGGLVGYNVDVGTSIRKSFAIGNVSGHSRVGGLVGVNFRGAVIEDSFARGAVSVTGNRAGGLVGLQYSSEATVERSYSTGALDIGTQRGGLIGFTELTGETHASYWDIETSGHSGSDGGEGLSTAEMKQISSYSGTWDFTNVWSLDSQVNDGYPYLRTAVAHYYVSTLAPSIPAPPITLPDFGTTVSGTVIDGILNGFSTILSGGLLNGGAINGTVNNQGKITGEVALGAFATVNGGVVSGNLTGQPAVPGRIVGATITADAQLSHVVIGEGTVLEPGVELGKGVRFTSLDQIPENTELARTLPQLKWNGDASVPVPDLNASVLESGGRSLASLITELPDFGPQLSEAGFDSQKGEFSLMLDDGRAALLPVSVQRHDGDEEVRVTAEGHVSFASPDGLRIEFAPVLVSADRFERIIIEELGLTSDSGGSVLVVREPGLSTDAGDAAGHGSGESTVQGISSAIYYVARPGLMAVPAHRHDIPGLHYNPMSGLGHAQGMSQVFESDDGSLLEQDIIASPADWSALRDMLWQLGDYVRDVRINDQGLITVEQDSGTIRARVELMVREGVEAADGTMRYTPAGDLSGNGVGDYWLIYPNGDRQAIFLY